MIFTNIYATPRLQAKLSAVKIIQVALLLLTASYMYLSLAVRTDGQADIKHLFVGMPFQVSTPQPLTYPRCSVSAWPSVNCPRTCFR